MEQITLHELVEKAEAGANKSDYIVNNFSADSFCCEDARQKLEKKYQPILEVTDKFDRRSVSYQLSKNEALHSWLKYKEGFSADLVNTLLDDMNAGPDDKIMDPFMGAGTTALVCQMRGVDSIGYDILPVSKIAITAKANVMKYNIDEIERLVREFGLLTMPDNYLKKTPYITITDTAYPEWNERYIQYAKEWILETDYSEEVKNLFMLCMVNSLERCSYTSKSGQYLSWDSRSKKVIDTNKKREEKGRKPLPKHYCREEIGNIKEAVSEELQHVLNDIKMIQSNTHSKPSGNINFRQNSVLFELPQVEEDSITGVVTSPPYCNRYDYTRTYALELVFLGYNDSTIKELRQSLLSCTVESRSKIELLRKYYENIGEVERFNLILGKVSRNAAFNEILTALEMRKVHGDLNNHGVLRMVEGYFTELAFVFAELYRVCKRGAMVAFVNDNVRYGGEVIPVDYLSTSFAEQFGFTPVKVYCLKQLKGNSSQQMKKYGRVPLRKSVTVWIKE